MHPKKRRNKQLIGTLSLIGVILLLAWVSSIFITNSPQSDSETELTDSLSYPFSFRHIHIQMPVSSYSQLSSKRNEALEKGLLITQKEDWVPATISEAGKRTEIKMRLKGDWIDHLKGDKWSYRVKVRDENAWAGLKVFSLQGPQTRNFLQEWILHQVMQDEGIMTTRYDFVKLTINEKYLGVYALEDHFTDEMLAANQRSTGPILKFSEDGMWDIREMHLATAETLNIPIPIFESASIEAFQEKQFKNDSKKSTALNFGRDLMHHLQFSEAELVKQIDVQRTATLQAINDVFKSYHGQYWHNVRFYYNPYTCKLEPILFDAYPGTPHFPIPKKAFLAYKLNDQRVKQWPREQLTERMLMEKGFLREYYLQLFRIADQNYIEEVFLKYEKGIALRQKYLRDEFILYRFNKDFYTRNIADIQALLGPVETESIEGRLCNDSLICIRNYSPLAIEVALDAASPTQLLHAFDPDFPADSALLEGSEEREFFFRIPGRIDWQHKALN